jgi:hypothetical protein
VDLRSYLKLASDHFDFANPGAFYGPVGQLSLGAGLIYQDVIFPLFDSERGRFDTVQGLAYVVTHECDVDQTNVRHFNDLIVTCPLIPLAAFIEEYETTIGAEQLKNLIVSAAKNEVFRVFFLPPAPELLGVAALAHGALMYLNHLCSTHVSVFNGGIAKPLCSLSSHGIERLDWKFQHLLFRPKAETLPRVR